jgi:hypothetical protein
MTTNLDEQPSHPVPAATPQTPSPNDQNMFSGVDAEQTAQHTAKAAEHPISPSNVENPCDSDILSTKSQDDIGGDAILDDPDSPSNSASRKVRESTAELFVRHPTSIANPGPNRQSPTPASTENRGLTSNLPQSWSLAHLLIPLMEHQQSPLPWTHQLLRQPIKMLKWAGWEQVCRRSSYRYFTSSVGQSSR